ncbi:MAG: dicarboxylate/amino acid:cation symporter [Planctomycetes bacterium]|nr:dicarboxylate/amino acid:cation symporter [Planctomycetota bacterium]
MSSSLSKRVLLAAIVGAALGALAFKLIGPTAGVDAATMTSEQRWLAGAIRYVIGPIGQVFLRLLFMLVAPLLFAALALGIAGLRDMKSLGRLGLKTLAYTITVSAIAVVLGVVLVELFQPGAGVDDALRARMLAGAAERAASVTGTGPVKTGVELFVQMVPDNAIKATANGDYLALMVFALFFGVGMVLTKSAKVDALRDALEGLYEVMMKLIALVIGFAPVGVFALMFTLTAQLGYEILSLLAGYVGVVLLGLALHQFVVYSLALKFLGKMSPVFFFRSVQDAMVTAFSTASSNATLPTALRVAEERLKLPPHVSRFVLTLGSTANQNGTALFEGVTVLFLAQFYGVELAISQQLMVVAVCVLGGIGTAGVPSGSLPVIALILGMIGVPVEGVGIIVGVNGFLDMCRTTLNVTGDLVAAVVVSRGEERT